MPVISKSTYIFAVVDALLIAFSTMSIFALPANSAIQLFTITFCFLAVMILIMFFKGLYSVTESPAQCISSLFESAANTAIIMSIAFLILKFNPVTYFLLVINAISVFALILIWRIIVCLFSKLKKTPKNVLIVGAGQDGKLIAEKIQSQPNLGMKVVGFLDDNMNTIEDEDSTIPILGLTCDSEAVIKDNNVKIVIIAVKSRMDSVILTDLVKGIPLGVKVWRMPKFYEKITHKYLVSKMTVNWLFYDCVRKKALIYANLKRFCDIVASILILILTSPLSIIAMLVIKLSDLGPLFFTQTRIGKFGQPFKMIKFRTMYQDKVEEDFDDDLNEIHADDKRIMPFCKLLRKFHIDELPQMINVLRGDMSIIGPRPVREEVYYENKDRIPFWECRNWVRPGWCGWQQVNICEPSAEERLEYDLYYIKHRHILWEFAILVQYAAKVLSGKCK